MKRQAWEGRAACTEITDGLDMSELTQDNARIALRASGDGLYAPWEDGPPRFYADDLRAAKELCSDCPVLAQCRLQLLDPAYPDIPGFAGGMTEVERADRRGARSSRRLIRANRQQPPPTAVELLALPDITPTTVAELIEAESTQPALDLPGFEAPLPALKSHGRFAGPVQDVVVRLTRDGLTSTEVAERLNLSRTQVRYHLQRAHGSKTTRSAVAS